VRVGSIRASCRRRRYGTHTIDALIAGEWSLFWQALHHLILPALVLAAFNVSLLTRFTRSAVLEVVGSDYVQSARAKACRSGSSSCATSSGPRCRRS
jgi:ABC-type dipeptide/oligopeptide/nickel transport system permease component